VADPLVIVHVYPDLLGTYGDRGNVLALAYRAGLRGLATEILDVTADQPLPGQGDLYVIGGGEDATQLLAARAMLADDRAASIFGGTTPVFAVCAGLQLLSRTFLGLEGRPETGLGLLDATCDRLAERAVGEIVLDPVELPGVPTLTGFENHRGTAEVGPGARPLGTLLAGIGNGDGRTEGVQQDNIVATYLHGPVLVRNPALADTMLERVTGPLGAVARDVTEQLREERLDAADPRRRPEGRRRRLRR
jgi:lipid II isoglutaminyl synthase (glutamine-hydrolysing)